MVEKFNKLSKRDFALIILALLVIVWGIYFYLTNRGFFNGKDPYEISRTEGELIAGFPREYVFENGVILRESTRTASDSQNFWTASYISSKTSAEIFTLYKNSLAVTGWEISNSVINKVIMAKKGTLQMSVAIEDKTNRREVVLSVLEK